MAIEQSLRLVASLLERHSVYTARLAAEQAVLLTLDEGVNITVVATEHFIRMTGIVGKVPQDDALYYDLLTENFKSAGHSHYQYALDAGSGELLIAQLVHSDTLEVNEWHKRVDDFIARCSHWMTALHCISLGMPYNGKQPHHSPHKEQSTEDFQLSTQFLKV